MILGVKQSVWGNIALYFHAAIHKYINDISNPSSVKKIATCIENSHLRMVSAGIPQMMCINIKVRVFAE